jgi:hypothetical protein
MSGDSIAQPLLWAHNVSCQTSSKNTSKFCYPGVANHTTNACDDCTLKYVAGLLSSEWGIGKVSENDFSTLLSSCKASPTDYPHSSVSLAPVPTYVPMVPRKIQVLTSRCEGYQKFRLSPAMVKIILLNRQIHASQFQMLIALLLTNSYTKMGSISNVLR